MSHGQYFNSVFHPDPNDTFADFFKPMYDWWGNPYENPTLAVNYPALAVLFSPRDQTFCDCTGNIRIGV